MILGAISLISLFLIVIITCAKIWNVVNGGKLYPEIFKYFGKSIYSKVLHNMFTRNHDT